ncbi:hypothetical protein H4582DRAFT_2055082 [Lactarius indigo]|nr:hypothetical protein H4582DRAFT_2055082 [Lactarius indigo]
MIAATRAFQRDKLAPYDNKRKRITFALPRCPPYLQERRKVGARFDSPITLPKVCVQRHVGTYTQGACPFLSELNPITKVAHAAIPPSKALGVIIGDKATDERIADTYRVIFSEALTPINVGFPEPEEGECSGITRFPNWMITLRRIAGSGLEMDHTVLPGSIRCASQTVFSSCYPRKRRRLKQTCEVVDEGSHHAINGTDQHCQHGKKT